jgi:sulfite reductase (NADPH) flavoprotein alpha-component
LVRQANAAGCATELHDLGNTRPKILKSIERAVFVLATHGIGEAPEGSEVFFDYWLADKAPQLNDLQFSVLALGDSSYADFCEMGRVFDARLEALGATAIAARVECDLDYQPRADRWIESVLERARVDGVQPTNAPATHLMAVPGSPRYSRQLPFAAEISQRQLITGRGSSKQVMHVEVDLEGSGLSYLPGDSLGVWPQNPPQIIEAVAELTGLDEQLLENKEITSLSRPILDAVAAQHDSLQAILEDRQRFADFLATRQLLDLAAEYPVDWQQPEYLDALRALLPRSYSIASRLDANPDEAHLTVAVLDYEKYGRRHWGAASNFLAGDVEQAPVFVEKNENFRLPQDGDAPIIMIGAGTGVAPYRAFVEHRREHGHTGDNWLIFGERNFASDFLYQLEWLRYRKEGLLGELDVAFSRDQAQKIYVQHRLAEKGARIFSWLERGAHLYVCGDATRMAGDVHAALLALIQQHSGGSQERAAEYLQELKQARRYQRDVY